MQGVEGEGAERELSVVDVLKAYEQAADGVKAAREVMVSSSLMVERDVY